MTYICGLIAIVDVEEFLAKCAVGRLCGDCRVQPLQLLECGRNTLERKVCRVWMNFSGGRMS